MTLRKYAITLGLIIISLSGFCQTKRPSVTVDNIDKPTAFTELIELFVDSDYFIQTIDKEVGFIQVKYKVEGKHGIFNRSTGTRIVYNIFLKELENSALLISLQANVENELWNRNANDSQYHYKDEGVSNKPEDYDNLLKLIEACFESQ